MRRPLPPELLELGDRLERAAAHALARRRMRRQQALNTVATFLVAVPLAFSLGTASLGAGEPAEPPAGPAPVVGQSPAATSIPDDVLPRDLRRQRLAPNEELLVLPSSLRPALR